MKEVMDYKDFCKEKGLGMLSQQSQMEYRSYTEEIEIEIRPDLDEQIGKAEEVLKKLSKKK